MMAKLAEVGFTPELHVLHVAQRASGSSTSTSRSCAHGPHGRLHAARTSGRTRPTSSRGPLRNGPPAAFRLRLRAGRHAGAVATASTPATSCARTSRRPTPTRSTCTPRSTRSSARDWDRPGLAGAVHHPAQRHPPRAIRAFAASCATSASTTPTTTRILVYSKRAAHDGARRRARASCNLDPHERARGHAVRSTSARSASPCDAPFEALRRADRRSLHVARARRPTSASTRPRRPPTCSTCGRSA